LTQHGGDAWRRYVELGLAVFPLAVRGKHPLTVGAFTNGVHTATTSADLLAAVYEQYPDANLGMAVPDGMIVVDVDPRNGGDQSLADLERRNGRLPDTWEQLTGGGGRHLAFRVPDGMRFAGKLAPGIDIKQQGGYIAVWPSVHPDTGRTYEWEASSDPLEGHPIADAPAWLLAHCQRATRADLAKAMHTYSVSEEQVQELRSALSVLDCDDRATWVDVGHALKTIGILGFELWDQWSMRSPKYRAGDQEGRWNGFNPNSTDYRAVFARAQRVGWVNPASRGAQRNVLEAPPPVFVPPAERTRFAKLSVLTRENLKPIDWLVRGYIERDATVMIYGPSGAGKSFVAVALAASVGSGAPWYGNRVKQGAVFYVAGEGQRGITNRVVAYNRMIGMDGVDYPLWISRKSVSMLDVRDIDDVAAEIEEKARESGHVPALVIIDTVARNFGDGDENSAQDASRFIRHCDTYIRERFGCTVVLVHHSGKKGEGARGSSAFRAACDQEYSVVPQQSGTMLSFQNTKMKDGSKPPSILFTFESVVLGEIESADDYELIESARLICVENPLDKVVGKTSDGARSITIRDVVRELHTNGWQGEPVFMANMAVGKNRATDIRKACVDAGAIEMDAKAGGGRGWKPTEKMLNAWSLEGGIITSGGGNGSPDYDDSDA
jgi:hypothetical protein